MFTLTMEREGCLHWPGRQFSSMDAAGAYVVALDDAGAWPEGYEAILRQGARSWYFVEEWIED